MSRRQKRVIAVLEAIVSLEKPSSILLILTLPFAWVLVVARSWHKPYRDSTTEPLRNEVWARRAAR